MPYIQYSQNITQGSINLLEQISTDFDTIPNNKSVYFHKDNNGNLKASSSDNLTHQVK